MSRDLLLIVDMITAWDYPDAEEVAEKAGGPVSAITHLKQTLGGETMIAYANDLEDGFHGSRDLAITAAMQGRRPDLVEPILPDNTDAFIHKGQHSAFYGTPLAHLLKVEGIEKIILTGQVTEQCILYTAIDAHVRGYGITVPIDAVVSRSAHLGAAALEMISTHMDAQLTSTDQL